MTGGKRSEPLEPLDGTLAQLEKSQILDAAQATGHNLSATAKLLGITRTTFYRRCEALGLSIPGKGQKGRGPSVQPGAREPLPRLLAALEKQEIQKALALTGGVRTAAAKLLGISRSRLYRRCEALAIHAAER